MSQAVRRVECQGVAEPAGASWSNALLIGREVVMSGMTAHPASREANLDCYAQTLVVLGKIQALVTAAGGHIGNIHRLTVYLTDIADKGAVGRARGEVFTGDFPCSTLVQVCALVEPGLRVEIEAEGIIGASRPNFR